MQTSGASDETKDGPQRDEDDAVAQANDTWSGLWSSGWSRDDRCATSIAESLRTGVTFFNNHNATAVMSIPT